MTSFSRWTVTMVLLLASVATAKKNPDATPAPTTPPPTPSPFIQTADNFVENDAAVDTQGMVPPVKLSFWTTPHRDWDSEFLMRFKGLVRRFGPHMLSFHPHEAIMDGVVISCRKPNGPNIVSKMQAVCLDNCANAGRYCEVSFPEIDDEAHAGLTGADIVLESARRLCVWIVYGQNPDSILKYFDYVTLIRETKCDLSLTDNCIDRVYREANIEGHEIASCIHDAGGVGSQIDQTNGILQEEMKRSAQLNTSYNELPHVFLMGQTLENVTTYSDWQLMAEVCTAFAEPRPLLCDFCLRECPIGNDFHDPTSQCLWDLTCGDDRTFDDWFKGTGPYSNSTGNITGATDEEVGSPSKKVSPSPSAPPRAPSRAPKDTVAPEDVTNTTTSETVLSGGDPNTTRPPLTPPNPNHNQHKPTTSSSPQMTPGPTPSPHQSNTPSPHQSKPSYNSPIAPPKPTAHASPTYHTPTNHSGVPQNHVKAPQRASPNSTEGATAVEGLAIVVVCLAGLLVAVVMIQRYRSGKDVYATVDRESSGLATTASHSTEVDLQLNVEMAAVSRRDGYAPPPKGTWG